MANVTTDQIVAFFNTLNPDQITKMLDDIGAKSSTAATAIAKMTTGFSNTKDVIKQVGDTAKVALGNINQINPGNLIKLIPNLAANNKELISFGTQFAMLKATVSGGFSTDSFNVLGKQANDASGSITDAVGALGNISKILPFSSSTKQLVDFMTPLAGLADTAKNAENGLIRIAAGSGELGSLLQNVGENLSGLNLKTEKFSSLTYELANSSGLSTKQVSEYAASLMEIPGAMDTTIGSIDRNIQDMSLLDASIKIATGTGQNFSQVFSQMNLVYREFGTTGRDALEYVTRLSAASQALKMPLDLVSEYTANAASSFKFLGDNSQAAINILERFGPALADSGMGPKAIKELVSGVTQSISQMGLAQKAFVSGQTGGAKGLQGAYQIEMLMRQGKMDEVQSKIESSLRKQFGGRIVTLEEASKDSRSAGQFTKQVQLLTQGPTKIAGSDSEAYRILDVLAKGGSGKAGSIIKPPGDAFKDALKTGDVLQDRQANSLTKIQNTSERIAQLSAISAYNLSRIVSGGKDNMPMNYNQKLITGQGIDQGKEVKEVIGDFFQHLPKEYNDTGKSLSLFKDHLMDIGGDAKDKIFGSNKKRSSPIQYGNGPRSSNDILNDNLSRGSQGIMNHPASLNKNNQNEKLDITVNAVCEKCMNKIAQDQATKIGRTLIQKRDSNKAISIQTGHDHGV